MLLLVEEVCPYNPRRRILISVRTAVDVLKCQPPPIWIALSASAAVLQRLGTEEARDLCGTTFG
eukprot:768473-Hanusia_phi.AAC.8